MPNPSLLPSNVVCTRSGAPLLCCQALALLQRRLYVTPTAFRPLTGCASSPNLPHATHSPCPTPAQHSPSRAERAVSSWPRAFSSSSPLHCHALGGTPIQRRPARRRSAQPRPDAYAACRRQSNSRLVLPNVPALSPPAAKQTIPGPALLPRPACV